MKKALRHIICGLKRVAGAVAAMIELAALVVGGVFLAIVIVMQQIRDALSDKQPGHIRGKKDE